MALRFGRTWLTGNRKIRQGASGRTGALDGGSPGADGTAVGQVRCGYVGNVAGLVGGTLCGEVADHGPPDRVVAVEVRIGERKTVPVSANKHPIGAPTGPKAGKGRAFFIPLSASELGLVDGKSYPFSLFDAETGTELELDGPSSFRWHSAYGHIDSASKTTVSGWVINCDQPDRPMQVKLLCDDVEVGRAVANLPRVDLRMIGDGTGLCGFKIALAHGTRLQAGGQLKLVVAESGTPVTPGTLTIPDIGAEALANTVATFEKHAITDVRGAIVRGWIADLRGGPAPTVTAVIDGNHTFDVAPSIPSAEASLAGGDINGGFQVRIPLPQTTGPWPPRSVELRTKQSDKLLWKGSVPTLALHLAFVRNYIAFAEGADGTLVADPEHQATLKHCTDILQHLDTQRLVQQQPKSDLLVSEACLDLVARLIADGNVDAAIGLFLSADQIKLMAQRARYTQAVTNIASHATPEQVQAFRVGLEKALPAKTRQENFYYRTSELALSAGIDGSRSLLKKALAESTAAKFGDTARSVIREVVCCFLEPDDIAHFNYLTTCEMIRLRDAK